MFSLVLLLKRMRESPRSQMKYWVLPATPAVVMVNPETGPSAASAGSAVMARTIVAARATLMALHTPPHLPSGEKYLRVRRTRSAWAHGRTGARY
ncbi:MAG: hypothetical protein ACRCYU_09735, partial [Nocardioides sp.]